MGKKGEEEEEGRGGREGKRGKRRNRTRTEMRRGEDTGDEKEEGE